MFTKQIILLRTKYPDGRGGTMGMRSGKQAARYYDYRCAGTWITSASTEIS
jgi:hypothetical protein